MFTLPLVVYFCTMRVTACDAGDPGCKESAGNVVYAVISAVITVNLIIALYIRSALAEVCYEGSQQQQQPALKPVGDETPVSHTKQE